MLSAEQTFRIKDSPQKLLKLDPKILNGGSTLPNPIPVGDLITAIPILVKKPVCSDCPDFPTGCILAHELIVLASLYKSTASARGLSPGSLTSWGCIPFRISPPPTWFSSRPHVVTCVCLFKLARDKVCWESQPRKQTRKRMFNCWVSSWIWWLFPFILLKKRLQFCAPKKKKLFFFSKRSLFWKFCCPFQSPVLGESLEFRVHGEV